MDAILSRGENRTKELNAKYEKLGLDDLQNFTSESAYEWNGKDFQKKKSDLNLMTWIEPAKRERKEQSYSMDKYFKQAMYPSSKTEQKPKAPRAPKQVLDQETAYYRKEVGYKVPLAEGEEDTLEDRQAEQAQLQEEIDSAAPLTEEEQEEKAELSEKGFGEWNRRDFQQFVNASGKYGRTDYERIAEDIDSKTTSQIRAYAKVFWQRHTEISDYQKYIKVIEDGEERMRRVEHQRKMLRKKISSYRVYTEEEDRFLLVLLDKYGIDSEGLYENIREEIRESPLFRFDWFFLSRTPIELSRRCTTLLTTIIKEYEDVQPSKANGDKKSKREPDDEENDEDSILGMAPAKKKSKNGVKNKALDNVKSATSKGSKSKSATPSRASSVASNASGGTTSKTKSKGRKK
ncbi:unnamed protein product [Parascedosporium putredinis]|uniref:SANT domain-containing protein n=1 Tax=Parascedosporium putredinis TaxID=1442378 RepID=A0A9P1H469_9PEZI|nr:unnamed protein product [Parascedosporium putredinis]CAI7995391.1 unnamed protein product [Parascedosporium putredinis]